MLCSIPQRPNQGHVEYTNRTQGSVAKFSCESQYILIGPASRTCLVNGMWSGVTPSCGRESFLISIQYLKEVRSSIQPLYIFYRCWIWVSLNRCHWTYFVRNFDQCWLIVFVCHMNVSVDSGLHHLDSTGSYTAFVHHIFLYAMETTTPNFNCGFLISMSVYAL